MENSRHDPPVAGHNLISKHGSRYNALYFRPFVFFNLIFANTYDSVLFVFFTKIPARICRLKTKSIRRDKKTGGWKEQEKEKHQQYIWNPLSHVRFPTTKRFGDCCFSKHGRWGHSASGETDIFASWIWWGNCINKMNGIWSHVQELNTMVFVYQLKIWLSQQWSGKRCTELKFVWVCISVRVCGSQCESACVCPGAHPSLCQTWPRSKLQTVTGPPITVQNGAHTDSHTLARI